MHKSKDVGPLDHCCRKPCVQTIDGYFGMWDPGCILWASDKHSIRCCFCCNLVYYCIANVLWSLRSNYQDLVAKHFGQEDKVAERETAGKTAGWMKFFVGLFKFSFASRVNARYCSYDYILNCLSYGWRSFTCSSKRARKRDLHNSTFNLQTCPSHPCNRWWSLSL